jgi:hypothetical protein
VEVVALEPEQEVAVERETEVEAEVELELEAVRVALELAELRPVVREAEVTAAHLYLEVASPD